MARTLFGILFALSTLAGASGCAIHEQGPVRAVAFDYSDAAYYDRTWSPSPVYGAIDYGTRPVEPVQKPSREVTCDEANTR